MTNRGGSSADTTSCEQWPHITRQDVYNIQMALLRNHGYGARRVDAGPDKDPMIHVVDNADRTVLAMRVSPDGLNWVLCADGGKPFVLPLAVRCADLADRVVAEARKPQ